MGSHHYHHYTGDSGLEGMRKATWLELFFDLIFVVAISKAAHVLLHVHDGHLEPLTYLKYILVMMPVCWAWVGHTLFADRFDCEDPLQRLMTMAQMFCAIAMSVYIGADFEANYQGFLYSYIALRALTVLMYVRASIVQPNKRAVSNYIGVCFAIGALISMSSIFFEDGQRFVVFYIGFVFDMIMPILGRQILAKIPVHAHHLPERFGLMTIIFLGESVVGLVHSFEKTGWTPEALVAGSCGFVVAASLWWTYFDNLERYITGQNLRHGQAITYPHFFIYLGLGGIAAMIHYAAIPELNLADYKLLSVLSVLCFMLTLHFLCVVYHPRDCRKTLAIRFFAFLAAFLIAVAVAPSAIVLIAATAVLLGSYAAFGMEPVLAED